LRDFWNRCVQNNFDEFRSMFLARFTRYVNGYALHPNNSTERQAFATQVTGTLNRIVDCDITHDPNRSQPPNWASVHECYFWMPGNLFDGRACRSTTPGFGCDPGPGFDRFASWCMPQDRYRTILMAWRAIAAYTPTVGNRLTAGRTARAACSALADVARYSAPTPFDPERWTGIILQYPSR
jgi:hypothetical protein